MSATLTTPKTTSGGEIITHLINSTDGTGLHFDGAAGSIDIPTVPDLGTKFSFEFIVQADSWERYQILFGFGTGGELQLLSHTSTSYNLALYDTDFRTFGSTGGLEDGKPHHIVITVDDTACVLYSDGNQVGTATLGASPNVDSCTDAAIGSNYGGGGQFWDGTFYRARFWNKTLSQAEVTASYENATVPFIDQYGSQTSKILNGTAWTGATGSTAPTSWTKGAAGTFTIDGSSGSGDEPALKMARTSADPYIFQTFTAIKGRKYRVKYRVKNVDATNVTIGLGSSAAAVQYGSFAYTSTAWTSDEKVITAVTTVFSVMVDVNTTTGTESGYVDSVTVELIGCVADYDLAFANPTQSDQVQDRAGVADGTASAGVIQVTKIEAVNTNKLNVGGTTPLVGIGVAPGSIPSAPLEVVGNVRANVSDAGGFFLTADTGIVRNSATGVALRTGTSGGTDRLIVDTGGLVGIGVTPTNNLHVAGNSATRNTIVSNATLDGGSVVAHAYEGFGFGVDFIGLDYGNALRYYAGIYTVMEGKTSSAGGGDAGFEAGLVFYTNTGGASGTNPTEKLRIDGAGNVGIGTSSPNTYGYGTAVVLTISDPTDNANNRGILELESTKTTPADGDYLGGIAFISKNNTNGKRCANIRARASGSTSAHFGGKLEFQTKPDNGAEATRLTISAAGLCSFANGIAFSSQTDAAGMTATTLNHYEEGTWTPAVASGAIAGTSITYAGRYTRIGRLVQLYCKITATASDLVVASYVGLSGLPFTAAVPASGHCTTEDIERANGGETEVSGAVLYFSPCGDASNTSTIISTITYDV